MCSSNIIHTMKFILIFLSSILYSACANSQKLDAQTNAFLDSLYTKQIISKVQYENLLEDKDFKINAILKIFPNSISINIKELSSKTNEQIYELITERISNSLFPNEKIKFIGLSENEKNIPLLKYEFNQKPYRVEDWNNINESIDKYLLRNSDNFNPIAYSTYICFNYFLMDNNSNERIVDICVNKGEETVFYFIKTDLRKYNLFINQKEISEIFHRHRFESDVIWGNTFSKDSLRIIVEEFEKVGLLTKKMNDSDFIAFIHKLRDYPHSYLNLIDIVNGLNNFSNFKKIDILDCLYKESEVSIIDNYLTTIYSIGQISILEENIKEAINKPDNQTSTIKISFKVKNKKYTYAKRLEPITHNDYPQNCIPSFEIINLFNKALIENMIDRTFVGLTPHDSDDEPNSVVFLTTKEQELISKLLPSSFTNF